MADTYTDKNKVFFGVSEIHVGTYTVGDDGTVSLGTPYALKGAKGITIDPEGDESNVYADDIKYWSQFVDNGFSGSMEVTRFTDEFKKLFMGYASVVGGGIASIKGATKPAVYVAFQSKGNVEKRRCIMYNVTLGGIKTEHKTVEDKIDVATETIDITVTGDNATGICVSSFNETDTGFATLFTTPPVPALAV